MGYWNETCLISNLPIMFGDPCAGFLITERLPKSSSCYSDSIFCPITPPIFGEYNDYGSLGKIQGIAGLEKAVLKNGEFYSWSEDNSSDFTPNPASFNSIGDMLKQAERKTLWMKSPVMPDKFSQVHLVLIRRDMYDFAVGSAEDNFKVVSKIKTLQSRLLETMQRQGSEFVVDRMNIQNELTRCLSPMSLCNSLVVHLVREGFDFSETSAVTQFLGEMRLQWIPTSGKGSQREIAREFQVEFYKKVWESAQDLLWAYQGNSESIYEDESNEDE